MERPLIVEVPPSHRQALLPLFSGHRPLQAIIEQVLSGETGIVYANSMDSPDIVGIEFESFAFLAGDAGHPNTLELFKKLPKENAIIAPTEAWIDTLRVEYPKKLQFSQRISLSLSKDSKEPLSQTVQRLPEGYELRPMDASLAQKATEQVSQALISSSFDSPEDFVKRGIGFCALWEGEPVSGASTAVITATEMQVQVNTHLKHQGKGIATAVCAALLLHSLEQGITPCWDAKEEKSIRLARRLGFTEEFEYDVITRGVK